MGVWGDEERARGVFFGWSEREGRMAGGRRGAARFARIRRKKKRHRGERRSE
jgi:hypothetical protein